MRESIRDVQHNHTAYRNRGYGLGLAAEQAILALLFPLQVCALLLSARNLLDHMSLHALTNVLIFQKPFVAAPARFTGCPLTQRSMSPLLTASANPLTPKLP